MIIRRRHTKSFVTLENVLVRDRRLSLDEHGMLHYLLSLPDDWEVSRANCAKFWNIGRDKAARIFRSLRKFGWAQIERVHGEDGTFLGVRWIITDEPGAEVPDEVLDRDVDDDEAPAETGATEEAMRAADDDPADEPTNHDTENPYDGSTVARVTRSTDKAYHGYNIDSKKTDSEENRLPQKGAREKSIEKSEDGPEPVFSDLLKFWPPDHVLSRVSSEQAWQHLSRKQRDQAISVAPRYLAECQQRGRKVCDLATYLREQRFERFIAAPNRGQTFLAKAYSPQWYRWRDYLKAMGQPFALMESRAKQGEGWTTSQEWPPALPPELRTEATGPPRKEVLMSAQDEADFR